MKYLKLYEQFRLIKESISGKKLILFSGPSASGKTYLATNPKSALSKKFKHWYEDLNSNEILIGTDTFMGGKNTPALYTLMENYGLKKYTEIAKGFPDNPWLIEVFDKDLYKKFISEASEEELKIWNEMNSQVKYDKTKCTGPIKNKEDGRVCGMAWVAYLHPAKTVIFDDVDTTIKNYFSDLYDILCFTPFEEYLSNIKSRINSSNPGEKIDVGNTESGIYQYMKWFKAVETEPKKDDISDYGTGGSGLPSANSEAGQIARAQDVNSNSLDKKFYTYQAAKEMLENTGYKKSEEILSMIGVSKDSSGFYIGKKENVKCDQIINTRDEASVKSAKV